MLLTIQSVAAKQDMATNKTFKKLLIMSLKNILMRNSALVASDTFLYPSGDCQKLLLNNGKPLIKMASIKDTFG